MIMSPTSTNPRAAILRAKPGLLNMLICVLWGLAEANPL
jgi:hypothetical protein